MVLSKVAKSAPPASNMWQEVQQDIFLRVLEHLETRSRVGDVALVCKHWCRLCLDKPPPLSFLCIKIHPTFGASPRSFFHHFSKLGNSVKHVEVSLSAGLPGGLAAQTLGAAAIVFPKMRELTIRFPNRPETDYKDSDVPRMALKCEGSDWDSITSCFPAFRQLECLRLLDVTFVPRIWIERMAYYETGDEDCKATDTSSQMFFNGMNLKELHVCNATECSYENNFYYTKALSAAIQALTSITKLHLDFCHPSDPFSDEDGDQLIEPDLDGVADGIAALPSLRCVTLMSKHAVELKSGWSNLTALTCLTIQAKMSSCVSLSLLPALQSLDLQFVPVPESQAFELGRLGIHSPQLLLPGRLTSLTHLAITSERDILQELLEYSMLPRAALQQLHGLVSFKLALHEELRLEDPYDSSYMDLEVLLDVPHLTRLDLSHNTMPCLPHTLTTLSNLQELDVRENDGLKLSKYDVDILKSMHSLKLIAHDEAVWSAADISVQPSAPYPYNRRPLRAPYNPDSDHM